MKKKRFFSSILLIMLIIIFLASGGYLFHYFWMAKQTENELSQLQQIRDRKSTRLNSSHSQQSRMPSSA